ncbi:glycosyltransferase family 2 protein [Pseudohoeflea coraliihabitans]|uniref:Glycosyltransferase family 2 protein n=1 Tax=Pseudohoeflea coraliihabitans TaxID=2860393 RepID=A0ABS6WLH6_9HYPH|nr:glycosyltransferase family A protein [Pseudohoeflea sp. DP4N28-3]MBW3096817.1 glycosyltransferase family 2 protein [Pseudohoeflea sp. DP4N28-3]
MKVSVIVPVYNRERYVGAALRSLVRQRDDADLDIIVVDDGSTDGTAQIIQQIMAEAACVRYVAQPNRGVTHARNAGLRLVPPEADLVTFLDSDDISTAGRFAQDLAHFKADPALDLTYGLMRLVDHIDDDQLAAAPGCEGITMRGVSLTTALFRQRAIAPLKGFDENFAQAEDLDFLLRLFERRPRYLLTDTVAILYRQHPDGMTKSAHEQMRRGVLQAVLRSAQRRKRDPSLGNIPPVFDMSALAGAPPKFDDC